jgi:hypothetical protein
VRVRGEREGGRRKTENTDTVERGSCVTICALHHPGWPVRPAAICAANSSTSFPHRASNPGPSRGEDGRGGEGGKGREKREEERERERG